MHIGVGDFVGDCGTTGFGEGAREGSLGTRARVVGVALGKRDGGLVVADVGVLVVGLLHVPHAIGHIEFIMGCLHISKFLQSF